MLDSLRQVRAGVLLGALMMVLAISATRAWAQGDGVPVLVMADDEDRTSVKRSSPIFKRVMGVLRDGLKRQGFGMIDEESVAIALDYMVKDRSSRRAMVEVAEAARLSGKAQYSAPAMALIRIVASMQPRGPRVVVLRLRMAMDIYDTRMKQFVQQYEMLARVFHAPSNCSEDLRACMNDFIPERAGETAADLSVIMGRMLSQHLGLSPRGQPSPAAGGHAVTTPYAVTFKSFARREALSVIGAMADEFPGYREHTLARSEPGLRRYVYVTAANPGKLEEWLAILLGDMGFKVDQNVIITIQGNEIVLQKVKPASRGSSSSGYKPFR